MKLRVTDFADHVHLIDRAARFRFQGAFLRRLSELLKHRAGAPASASGRGR